MTQFDYVIGEAGTLGFPIDQPDGAPMPLDGLSLRLVLSRSGVIITIPGYVSSGPFRYEDGSVLDHPSIAAFDFTGELILEDARTYRCAVQIQIGNDWSTLDGHGDHRINARRP
ncbi:hypothetical protein [Paracoccus aestuariivivens]|uniref:Uncharacterized protein n=1 Tax=Paracoccus aestuariivivens TaxID=1820333 RepID=A0A6L6J4Z5_9RHOB|nr:hypothetical protein [Paracoccus aestuariivivens]MTH76305.1 hypothetical protein [Paracoccus aestuariivivens]